MAPQQLLLRLTCAAAAAEHAYKSRQLLRLFTLLEYEQDGGRQQVAAAALLFAAIPLLVKL